MKKKNGFTLIELLAVIVILSLIALIAIPMIMNVIESSRKGAYEESLRNLIKATEYYETSEEILGNNVDFSNGLSVLDSHIEMKNKNFKTGIIKKNENGELYLENVSDGNYCGNGTIDQLTIIKGNCGEVELPKPVEPFTFDSIMTDEKAGSNGSINIDTHNNKRFAGSNPNNYVCFGMQGDACDEEHLYRMIGVIDGQAKLIKNSYYNEAITWDTKGGEKGSNDWARPADLNAELNGDSFYGNTSYIDAKSKDYISNATWHTGGIAYVEAGIYLSMFETVERNTSTSGYIGLMSIVDFGYASNAEGCNKDETNLFSEDNECVNHNWLFDSSISHWTITPTTGTTDCVWFIRRLGKIVNTSYTNAIRGIRPSLFLDSSVKMKSGEGTKENPYILVK